MSTVILVLPVGIEPTSTALQTAAMTTSAKAAHILKHTLARQTSGELNRFPYYVQSLNVF